jgi:hypothetical protein
MKILKAPKPLTVTLETSQGTIEFENGIAVEFTEAQAQHMTTKFKGYSLEELPDPVEKPKAKPSVQHVTTANAPKDPKPVIETPEIVVGTDAILDELDKIQEPAKEAGKTDAGAPAKEEPKISEPSPSPDDEPPPDGTGEPEKASEPVVEEKPKDEETVELPVIQDGKTKIVEFAKRYGIDSTGTMKEILARIYADTRFNK